MVLTIDIGNTNIVLGGYENGALGFCTRISTDKSLEADQYALELSGILNLYKVAGENIEGAIISSVVPQITDTVARALRMFAGVEPLKLTQELPTGVGVNIDTPSELGADLLAGAIAAKALYPLPAIVIDMGTATKITAVDEQGTVQGVSIMPGVFISLDALVNGTSLLKGIATNAPVRAIGKNTVESMQSGVVFGAASMLDGMVERFEAELGPAKTLVATGGGHCCAALPAQRAICAHTHSGRPLCRVLPHTRGPVKNGRKKHGRAFSLLRLPLHAHKTEKPLCAARRGAFPAFCTGDAFILRPCRRSSLHSLRRRRRPR